MPIESKTITVEGLPYFVRVTRSASTWGVRLEAEHTEDRSGAHSQCVWDVSVAGLNEAEAARARREAAVFALRIVRDAFPREYAGGAKVARQDGTPAGWVEFEEMPEIVAKAIAPHTAFTMKDAARKMAESVEFSLGFFRRIDSDNPLCMSLQAARCLAHALEVGDVPAQMRWALWIVDPEAAIAAEMAAMRGPA